jgi:outer membrane protein TolC
MPVFDFGRKKYSVEDAQNKLREIEMDLINAKNTLAKDISQKIIDIKNIENSVVAAKKGIDSAQETYDYMRDKYAQNMVTLSAFLEAQYDLFSAKNDLNRLTSDHRLAYVKLKMFIGEILPPR